MLRSKIKINPTKNLRLQIWKNKHSEDPRHNMKHQYISQMKNKQGIVIYDVEYILKNGKKNILSSYLMKIIHRLSFRRELQIIVSLLASAVKRF